MKQNYQSRQAQRPKQKRKSSLPLLFFYYVLIVFSELVFRIATVDTFVGIGLVYILVFSAPVALGFYAFSSAFPEKVNRFISILLTSIIAFFYSSQIVYNGIFHTYYTAFSAANGGQVIQFWQEVLNMALQKTGYIALLVLPLVALCVFGKKFHSYKSIPILVPLGAIAMGLIIHFAGTGLTFLTGTEQFSPYDMYFKTRALDYSIDKLGLFTSMRIDVQRLAFGFEGGKFDHIEVPDKVGVVATTQKIEPDNTGENSNDGSTQPQEPVIDTSPNIMQIDFADLVDGEIDETIKNMHLHFSNVTPTNKNEKTGSEKGNNLILIVAEGFSEYAIDEKITPTLYKMYTQGYQFPNFYTPIWGVSTSDGEYVTCTGLIPKSGVWSFKASSENYLPFVMGHQLKDEGYSSNAYHNHDYDYYSRDMSHPNMGYIYKGDGNGLDMERAWPESDLEMIDETVDEYIKNDPFHVYYLTVSGHLEYTYMGNAMATRNREYIESFGLEYSSGCQAYIACNYELEKAMTKLLAALNEQGVAENTLIAITPDHYPYGLKNEQISEFLGHDVEENFELYQSVFILYRQGMEPEVVDKYCSHLDILPTISNLLGIEYDSRLLMGRDIFSDADPLVIFANRSWITDKAMYNAKTKEVTPLTDEEVTDDYIKEIKNTVNEKFAYSEMILDEDYYRIVFEK